MRSNFQGFALVRNSPELSHFATFFLVQQAKVSIVKSCFFVLNFFLFEVVKKIYDKNPLLLFFSQRDFSLFSHASFIDIMKFF